MDKIDQQKLEIPNTKTEKNGEATDTVFVGKILKKIKRSMLCAVGQNRKCGIFGQLFPGKKSFDDAEVDSDWVYKSSKPSRFAANAVRDSIVERLDKRDMSYAFKNFTKVENDDLFADVNVLLVSACERFLYLRTVEFPYIMQVDIKTLAPLQTMSAVQFGSYSGRFMHIVNDELLLISNRKSLWLLSASNLEVVH